VIFENECGAFEVGGYGFELGQNVLPDEAVGVQELEVSDDCIETKGASPFLQVRVLEDESYRKAKG
jgi:hypothetical protein